MKEQSVIVCDKCQYEFESGSIEFKKADVTPNQVESPLVSHDQKNTREQNLCDKNSHYYISRSRSKSEANTLSLSGEEKKCNPQTL